MQKYDAIVVGGGHNGLVNAAYLGKAGLKVALLDVRWSVGPLSPKRSIPALSI